MKLLVFIAIILMVSTAAVLADVTYNQYKYFEGTKVSLISEIIVCTYQSTNYSINSIGLVPT